MALGPTSVTRPAIARPLTLLAAWALSVVLALAYPAGLEVIGGFEARLSDAGWRIAARTAPEERLVLVDIDEKSLAELGPWPWPRERLAMLTERLGAAGAALQVWDVVLDTAREGDAGFAAILQRNRAVLAAAFALPGQGEAVESGRLSAVAGNTLPCGNPWRTAHGQRAPAARLDSLPVGHITPRVDTDGIVRAVPAFICRGEQAWPALSLAAYLAATGSHPGLEPGQGLTDAPWRLAAGTLPAPIPLNAAGELVVPWQSAPSAFRAVSAADLLADRVPDGMLAGRIALVGSTAFGLADVVATPFAGAQAGMLVHAELLAGLLDGHMPYPPLAAGPIAGGVSLVALLLLWLLAARRPAAWLLPVAGLLLAALLVVLQLVLQARLGWLVGLGQPITAALLAGLLLGTLEFFQASAERGRLFAHLASYLPVTVAHRLRAMRPQDQIFAETREASILVADLRNFTAWSEKRSPDEVAGLLHRFLVVAVEIVESHNGVVEALEGDAVLAVWNGLTPCGDHAGQALAAAKALHVRMQAELPASDPEGIPPPLALGLGLDAGPVLVGSLGPRSRRQHLALGLPVTRAVRLAGMTSDLSWPILLGPGLTAQLTENGRAGLVPQGEFLLEGLIVPCQIHAAA